MTKEPEVAPDTREILEKYDKDSVTRKFDSKSIFWLVDRKSVV